MKAEIKIYSHFAEPIGKTLSFFFTREFGEEEKITEFARKTMNDLINVYGEKIYMTAEVKIMPIEIIHDPNNLTP